MLHGSKYLNSLIRIALWSALAGICGAAMPAALAQQSFTVMPTTTLSAETANNTSAYPSFAALSNGDIAPGNVSKLPTTNLLYSGATTAVYAQFQPWFGQSSHINVGYNSDDPTQVRNQVTDMVSRGISGAIVDWYGPDAAVENNTTLLMKTAAENTNGAFVFAVQEDVGALSTCASTSGCNVTNQLISDLAYAYSNFEGSKAYMLFNGRPVLFFFGVDKYAIDWDQVRRSVSGNPYFVFIGTSGMTHADADGYYSWVIIDTSNPDDESLSGLSTFYSGMQLLPNDLAYGASYIGFNESLAPWIKSNPRIMNQHCGQTWLDTFGTVAAAGYSAGKQLQAIQIVTWNDYEEGTEIETGISNCLTISPAINGTQLQWSITGNEKAVDHYVVFISLNGQDLMNLASVASGTHTFDLSSYNLAPGTTYKFLVEAHRRALCAERNVGLGGISAAGAAAECRAYSHHQQRNGSTDPDRFHCKLNLAKWNRNHRQLDHKFRRRHPGGIGPQCSTHVQDSWHIYGYRYGNGQHWRNRFDDAEGYGFTRNSNRSANGHAVQRENHAHGIGVARWIILARRHYQ